jgi:Sulfotransferase family
MGAVSDSRPIVVGGCYRSGTSLVRRLLDSHPRIHCGPEVKLFRDYAEAGLRFASENPTRYVRLLYQDLVGEPETTVRALIGVPGGGLRPRPRSSRRGPRRSGPDSTRKDATL